MPIEFKRDAAVFSEAVAVEEAELLLQWIQEQEKPKVDLAECTHMHTANLQVLLAADASVLAWPEDKDLKTWLKAAMRV